MNRKEIFELLTRNEKVKKNFRVINIIGHNALNKCSKITCQDIEVHWNIINCPYNIKSNFYELFTTCQV